MDQDKLIELNDICLFLVKEIIQLNFDGLEKISVRDYTSEDPTQGYSIGFSSPDSKSIFTLYFFSGDTYPVNSDVLKRSHLTAVSDVFIHNPDLEFKDNDYKIEYYRGTDDMIGHLKTSLQHENGIPGQHVIVSSYFFGLIIKVRATLEDGGICNLENFLKQLTRSLFDIYLRVNSDKAIVS